MSKNRIPVLFVAVPQPTGEIGGSDVHLLELLQIMQTRDDFEPAVLLFRGGEFAREAESLGVPTLVMEGKQQRLMGSFTLNRILQDRTLLPNPCIVHSQGYYSSYVTYMTYRQHPKLRRDTKWVISCHGWLRPTLGWKLLTELDIAICPKSDAVCVVSEEMAEILRARGLKDEAIHLFHYWPRKFRFVSDAERMDIRLAWKAGPNNPLLGFVGRLSPEKRPDLFIQTCARLKERNPLCRFVVVGGGDNRKYRELAKGLGLQSEITFAGLVKDMALAYKALDLLIVTSDTEGMPNVILEAWFLDVPIVARRVGGIPEFTEDGKDILLVSAAEPQSLARASLEVLSSPKVAELLKVNGHLKITTRYGSAATVDQFARIYSHLLTHVTQ